MAARKKNKEITLPAVIDAAIAEGNAPAAVEEVLVESNALSLEGRQTLSAALRELDADDTRIKQTRHLVYMLTPDERQAMRVESSAKLGLRVEVDQEISDLTDKLKRLKKRSEAIDAEAVDLLRIADEGTEMREVECVEVFDPAYVVNVGDDKLERGAVVTIRRDRWSRASDEGITNREREELKESAIIDARAADKAARQGSLFS